MSIFLAFTLGACADFSLEADNSGFGGSDTGKDQAEDGDGTDTAGSDSDNYVAAWYTLGATLAITGGLPATDGAEVRFVLGDSSLNRQDCDPLDTTTLLVVDPPVEGTFAQWSLTVPTETGCAARELVLPSALSIAITPLDPEVRAQLGSVELEDQAPHLWGASFAADGGEFHAFGYAEGAADADASVAPPDGTYVMEPLLLQPVPVAE